MTIQIVYVMHPFSAQTNQERDDNLRRASEWCAFLTAQFGALFTAPWIPMCRHWSGNKVSLDRGLALDCACIERMDSCIAVGGRMSPGMLHEKGHAESVGKSVFDASRFRTPNELLADIEAMESIAKVYGWGARWL